MIHKNQISSYEARRLRRVYTEIQEKPCPPYPRAEVVPSGWRQTRASCSDGSQLPNVDVAAGEDVTCTFENAQESTIVVAKFALGGSELFTYTSQALGTFVLTPTNSVAQRVFSGLTAGPYDITEAAAPGWVSVDPDPVCSNGDRAGKLFLADGETIYCFFTNVKQDSIIIEKRTTGGDGTFDFTGSLGNLQLTTSGGYTRTIVSGLNPGTYNIAETVPAGWTQSSATCDNGDASGSVTLGLGEVVTCTFENTKLGKIEVLKRAVGGDDTFSFSSPQFGAFDLKTAGTAKRDFFDLAAGTYAITETVVAGWDLSSVSCTDSSNPAAISLATGEEVTCFFTNSRQGSITIIKESTGGDGVFDFSSQALGSFVLTTTNGTAQWTFTNLTAGSYDISENVPADWAANGATCSDGSDPANISLAYNEDVICTYRNLKRSNLTVIKTTVSGDDVFNFDSSRFGSFAITTTNGTAQQSFTNLLPGVYDVTESLSQKWEQVNATCDNGDTPAHVTLNPGDDVICTIENRERSVVIYLPQILKSSRPMIYLPLILYQQPQVVYSNNFNQTAGSEWSTVGRSATAPLGERFLGEFSNETTSLSLSGLPAHSQVTVSFDLYIIRSWAGNQVERPTAAEVLDLLGPAALDQLVGPDRWVMKQGSETLIDTSFANIPIFKQAYPGGWGVGDYPAQTGSSAVGTLGYILGPTSDATYRIVRTFSHSAADLSLSFEAIGLQNIEDESWGIDNIVVMVE